MKIREPSEALAPIDPFLSLKILKGTRIHIEKRKIIEMPENGEEEQLNKSGGLKAFLNFKIKMRKREKVLIIQGFSAF